MKLSKSKPNLKHKKIISMNEKNLKKSISRIREDEKKETFKDNQNQILESAHNSKNNINAENIINNNNNESEVSNSTQLDWVKSAIQVKTKNNEIIKLSLENETFDEQVKIKVNKLQKYKDLDFLNKEKEKEEAKIQEYKINEDINYNNSELTENRNSNINNLMNLNKIDNKESAYMMISTKESEKNDNNFKYLSGGKNKNIKITFPVNFNDDNNDEDMVNMKTVTIFNTNTELNNINNLFNKNKIYRKRIKTGFLNFNKNNSKNSIISKMFDNRNNNYLNNFKYNTTNNEKKGKIINMKNIKSNGKIFSINLDNKNLSQRNISISNLNKPKNKHEAFNDIHDFDNSSLNNSNLNQTTQNNYIKPYINYRNNNNEFQKKNAMFLNYSEFKSKKNSIFSNYMYTEKTEINNNINKQNILNDNNNENNNTITQSYKYITPNKTLLKKGNKYYPSSKFIKKNISQKFLLTSNNKSNLLLKNFLAQIHLEKYFSTLKLNGFDNINYLIEQMKTNVPIKDLELKKAGIPLPGDRAKILIRLEEKGNLFPFSVPKNVYYSLKDKNINIEKDENIIELKRWLKEFKLENYLDNFIQNGYHSVKLFLFQMISKNPIDSDILKNEIGIEKIGHRSRILSILKEESRNMEDKLSNKEPINFSDETKNCDCFIF